MTQALVWKAATALALGMVAVVLAHHDERDVVVLFEDCS